MKSGCQQKSKILRSFEAQLVDKRYRKTSHGKELQKHHTFKAAEFLQYTDISHGRDKA